MEPTRPEIAALGFAYAGFTVLATTLVALEKRGAFTAEDTRNIFSIARVALAQSRRLSRRFSRRSVRRYGTPERGELARPSGADRKASLSLITGPMPPPAAPRRGPSKKRRCQFDFGFCVDCLLSQLSIKARARNSASSRDPVTTLPFISTPAG